MMRKSLILIRTLSLLLPVLTACTTEPKTPHREGSVAPIFYPQASRQCDLQPDLPWCPKSGAHPK